MKSWISYFYIAILAIVLSLSSLYARGAGPESLTGDWAREDGAAQIAIVACGQQFCATNTWVRNTSGSERVGDELILTVKPGSSSELHGQAYDLRRKATYKITIRLQSNTMNISGCVFLGIVCKNANWEREN
jgi:uncharacterized protein (DUF2147 family)